MYYFKSTTDQRLLQIQQNLDSQEKKQESKQGSRRENINEYRPNRIQTRIMINYYLKRQTPSPEQVTVEIKQPSAISYPQTKDTPHLVHRTCTERQHYVRDEGVVLLLHIRWRGWSKFGPETVLP
jgi:hypothetical protein